MTSLVHTADVHLRPDAPDRTAALEAVLRLARDRDADAVTIGGDLFDRPTDVEALRADLRADLFADQPFEILLIPGNHDVEAFRGDLFFGDACTVLTAPEDGYDTWVSPAGDLRVVGVPYQETATDELLLALDERPTFDGTDVLLLHGSLDAPIDADAGDEDAYRYFPVTETQLDVLGFDYYLAGHYHGPHQVRFDGGGTFAYPGTPASTRRSETGQRQAVTLDVGRTTTTDEAETLDTEAADADAETADTDAERNDETEPETDGGTHANSGADAQPGAPAAATGAGESGRGLAFVPLDTFHHRETTLTVVPGEEDAVVAAATDWVDANAHPDAALHVAVEGVVDVDESAFADRLPDEATNRTVSVAQVATHPVVQEFRERLDDRDWDDETTQQVWLRTLRVASRLRTGGGLD